jgi:hypothetical protein
MDVDSSCVVLIDDLAICTFQRLGFVESFAAL